MVAHMYKRIETYFEKQNYELKDATIGNTKELKPNLVRKILYIYVCKCKLNF